MYETRFSWIKDLINTDAKAHGVYLALLYLRFNWYYSDFESAPSIESYTYSAFESFVRGVLAQRLLGRGRYEAFEAAKTFFNKLFAQHVPEALKARSKSALLEQIEGEFLETFTKAYIKYLRVDEILREFRERMALFYVKFIHGKCTYRQRQLSARGGEL
jgi:hypothetical protein